MSLKDNKPLVLVVSILIFHLGWIKWLAPDWFYVIDYAERLAILAIFVGAFGWPSFRIRIGFRDLAAIVLALAGFAAIHLLKVRLYSAGYLPQLWPSDFYPTVEIIWLKYFDITVGLALVALSEEIVYRKLAYEVFASRFKPAVTFLISSLLFAALHIPMGTAAVFGTFLDGFLFMTLYRWRGRLLIPVVVHFLVDVYFFYDIHEIFVIAR